MVVHLLLVYKSSAMVPFNIHHQLHSRILEFSTVFTSSDLATNQRALIHSLLFVEMFSKSFVAPIFLLALTSSVNAQCSITPSLGASNDVQQPSEAAPCGTINIAQNLGSSTPLAPTEGYYYPVITNAAA